MSISFERRNTELILCYSLAIGVSDITKRLSTNEKIPIKRTFFVTKSIMRETDEDEYDFEDTLRFCIGQIGVDYIQIDSNVINTNHQFYFSNDIKLTSAMFVAYRNISILRKIDGLIESDFYIGGSWESKSGISIEAYMELIRSFPKTAELNTQIAELLIF